MIFALLLFLAFAFAPAAYAAKDAGVANSSAEPLAALLYFRKDHSKNDTVRFELYPLASIRNGSFEDVGRSYFTDLDRDATYQVYHGGERVGRFVFSQSVDTVFQCSGIPIGIGGFEASRKFDPFAAENRRVRRIRAYLPSGDSDQSLVAYPATSVLVDQGRFQLSAASVAEELKTSIKHTARELLKSLTVRWAGYGKELERPDVVVRSLGIFDLDLDGRPELGGLFTQVVPVKITEERHTEVRGDWLSLMLWMDVASGGDLEEILSEHMDVKDGSWGVGYELLGVLDFDGDGDAEVLVQKTGWETTDFLIYTLRNGKLEKVFEGAGYGC